VSTKTYRKRKSNDGGSNNRPEKKELRPTGGMKHRIAARLRINRILKQKVEEERSMQTKRFQCCPRTIRENKEGGGAGKVSGRAPRGTKHDPGPL